MEIILPAAQEYALAHSSSPDSLTEEVLAFTLATHPESHMISGPLQGMLLSMISRMLQPQRILEIGTFTGYSALCLAEGLGPGGILHTIEKRAKDAATAAGFFSKSRFASRIIIHQGEAMEKIMELQESWDLVFIDADKTGYINYYDYLVHIMKPGSWIIADNVFFHGEAFQQPTKGKNAQAIDAFNKHVEKDDRVEKLMLTIRDGLTIMRIK